MPRSTPRSSPGPGWAERLLIIRPGLISGPGDPSDRFGYWAARFSRGGPILIPETTHRWVQTIDVSDLATFVLHAGSIRAGGEVNALGTSAPLAEFFAELSSAAPQGTTLLTAPDEWLLHHGMRHWAGPRSLPLWLPLADAGFAQRSNAAFLRAGGTPRPLRETAARVILDERRRGLERPRRSGLSLHEESEILRVYREAAAPHFPDQDQSAGER